MATFKTKGIIIKRTNLGEADRIITIYTEKHGKVKAVAKGVRKTLSKMAGHLELFCLTDFVIAQGRNLDTICSAETIKCFFRLRNHLNSTHQAYYLAEIIEVMTGENEAHQEVFELLDEVLERIDNRQDKLLLAYFVINLLATSGFRPELYHCLKCRQTISTAGNYFGLEEGGLVCGQCRKNDEPISDDAIKVLRLFLRHKIKIIQKIKTNEKLALEVENIADKYLSYISQKEFKSKRFLKV